MNRKSFTAYDMICFGLFAVAAVLWLMTGDL